MAVSHSVDIRSDTIALHLAFIDHILRGFRRNDNIFSDPAFIYPKPVIDAAEILDLLGFLQFGYFIAESSFVRCQIFRVFLLNFSVHLKLHVKVVIP